MYDCPYCQHTEPIPQQRDVTVEDVRFEHMHTEHAELMEDVYSGEISAHSNALLEERRLATMAEELSGTGGMDA